MLLIDADALKKAIIKHLCVKSENNLLPAEKSIYDLIDKQPKVELPGERQPKKPIYDCPLIRCPRCKMRISINQKYCDECGQAIDWRDGEQEYDI